MKKVPEINDETVIKNKLDELQSNYGLVNLILNLTTGLKTKLTLDLSPDCSELGKHAAFIVDCRDKIINQKIMGLVTLLNAIKAMQNAIANGQTNKDFNKIMDGSFVPVPDSPSNQ